jgi:hypothetical protein
MPHVLSVTTSQIGNPIATVILVISDDRLLHVVMISHAALELPHHDRVTDVVSSAILPGSRQRQRFSKGCSGR